MKARDTAAGLTLVEMLVALALFAMVGIASFTTLDAIIRTRDRTEGRLEQIAHYDRALLLFSRDVMQGRPEGTGSQNGALVIAGRGDSALTWDVQDNRLTRRATRPDQASGISQTLLDDVLAVKFSFLNNELTWVDDWPLPMDLDTRLRAVRMTLDLGEPYGMLVRLAEVVAPVPPPMAGDILSNAVANAPPTGDSTAEPAQTAD